ncbi:hypothetical protein CLU79DRAFT_768305 [Phycomyces nitens]|nr:hypothetical protein CLU79DRAFT_768305 [Phycomyces nitens]
MFCSLKTLETNDNSYYAGNMISLHHGIELFEPQIEKLSICLQTFQKRYLSLESVLYFTYVFAATLKELTLTLSIYCYPIKSTLNQTIYYPVLMHLNMNILDGYVQIDYVLNQCPLLQTFQVYGYAVTLGQNPSSFPHGLRELKIDCKCLDIDVMSYISYRCRYLGRLKLNVLSLNPRQLKKTFFVFDMGYTQLDELYISNIIIMTGPCRLFTIEETDKCGQYENSDPSCASSQKLKTYKALPICYALQKIRSSGIPKTFRAVRMSRRHIRKVQMCYPNFGCPSSPHEEVEYTSEVDHIPDNYWKPFVYKGYLTFKCKSVKNHHILPYEPRL